MSRPRARLLIACCLAGCGGSSPSRDGGGPGAASGDGGACDATQTLTPEQSLSYAPIAVGDRWTFGGRAHTLDGASAFQFQQRLEVTGTKTIDGVEAFVITDSSSDGNPGATEEYLSLGVDGLVDQGASANASLPGETPTSAPYVEVPFPVRVCSTFEQLHAPDQDQTAIARSLGPVTVSGISFPDALRVERTLTSTYTPKAKAGFKPQAPVVTTAWTAVDWYAPGFGRIKRTVTDTRSAYSYSYDYDITGALVGGVGHGVLPGGTIAQIDEDEDFLPGLDPVARPGIASDGTRFLVATGSSTSFYDGALAVVLVGLDGHAISTTNVAAGGVPSAPAAAWGGGRYLVAYPRFNSTPQAVLLDQNGAQQGMPLDVFGNGTVSAVYGKGVFLIATTQAAGVTLTSVSPQGTVLGEMVPYPGQAQGSPALAFDGSNFLLTWLAGPSEGTHVWAGRVNADGNAIDVTPTQITKAAPFQEDLDVAFDGARYVVAWFDRADPSVEGSGDVRIARVAVDGTLLDPGGRVVAPARTNTSHGAVRIGRVGSQAVVVWARVNFQEPGSSTWVAGTRIAADGSSLDSSATSDGLYISAQPALGVGASPILPAIGWSGDRSLVAWVDRAGEDMKKRTIDASLLYPWEAAPIDGVDAGATDGAATPDDAGASDGGTCAPRRCGREIACGVAADGCGNSVTCDPCPDVARVLRLDGVRHLAVDDGRGVVYVTMGAKSAYPSSVLVVDPAPPTPVIKEVLAVGADPNVLALSDDGSRLWVGVDGDSSIQRIDLGAAAPAVGPEFKLPPGFNYPAATKAGALAALHDNADATIVALAASNGDIVGIVALDAGVPRAAAIRTDATCLAVGPGSDVFGVNGFDSSFDYCDVQVSAQGLKQVQVPQVFTNFSRALVFGNNRVYSDAGDVVDVSVPSTPRYLGKLPMFGAVRPLPTDPTRVLLLTPGPNQGPALLNAIDTTTFAVKASASIAGAAGAYLDLQLLGNDTVVFIAEDPMSLVSNVPNRLVVARTSLLP
jgi:hypothetical protein